MANKSAAIRWEGLALVIRNSVFKKHVMNREATITYNHNFLADRSLVSQLRLVNCTFSENTSAAAVTSDLRVYEIVSVVHLHMEI